jgi:FKBP-type peptidyl-prolyl cis-trans isomerase
MNLRIACLFAAGVLLSGCDAMQTEDKEAPKDDAQKAAGPSLETDAQKRSYALGMDIGNSVKDLPVELQTELLAAGIRDTVRGEAQLSQEEFQKVMEGFVAELETAQEQKATADAEANRKEGETFLAENKAKEGVKVTDSGLQYKVLEEGDGPSPESGDQVTIHYTGTLIDGTEFDSSRDGEPATFAVDQVIPGFSEGLKLMEVGSRYRLVIPGELGYGAQGAGQQIGPGETLIFDVELLGVE